MSEGLRASYDASFKMPEASDAVDIVDEREDDDYEDAAPLSDLSFSVTACRDASRGWVVHVYDDDFSSLDAARHSVLSLRAEGPAFALLCVDDEYFVILRPAPSRMRVFASDASVDDDLIAAVLDEVDADVSDYEDEEPWPVGDFDILEDVGISEQVLGVICDDSELWASEQLLHIAAELGFDEQLADAVGLE